MRVLIVTPNYPSVADPIGGAFYRTQARALHANGFEVMVLSPHPWVPALLRPVSKRWARYSGIPPEYELDGIKILSPAILTPPRDLRLGLGYRTFVRKLSRVITCARPSLIHGHFGYPSGLASVIAARRFLLPSLVTFHGSDVNSLPTWGARPRRHFLRTLNDSTQPIAVSEALAERAASLGGRRPLVLPLGVDLSRFRAAPPREEARRSLGVAPNCFLALFIGALSNAKGVPELLDSLSYLPENVLIGLVGSGPLQERVRSAPRALYFGAQAPEAIPRFLAAADLLLLPSHSEGMPTVLVEAGAARTPAMATPVGGIPELLGNDRGFLLPPAPVSPRQLAQAIASCVQDVEARSRKAEALHQHVVSRYDASANAAELGRLYERLCRSPRELHP